MIKALAIDWKGGEILVTRADLGWQLEHKLPDGRTFGLGWKRLRHDAMRLATSLADERGAFVVAEAP